MTQDWTQMPRHLYVDIPFHSPLGRVAAGAHCTGGMPGRATRDPRDVTCEECLAKMKVHTDLMERLAEHHEAQARRWEGQEEEGYVQRESRKLASNMRRFVEEQKDRAQVAQVAQGGGTPA